MAKAQGTSDAIKHLKQVEAVGLNGARRPGRGPSSDAAVPRPGTLDESIELDTNLSVAGEEACAAGRP